MGAEMLAWSLPCRADAPITQLFGENPELYARLGLKGHTGIDFGLTSGSAVLSMSSGRVKQVGQEANYGLFIRLDHGQGIETLYAHLLEAQVKPGQKVSGGEQIGLSGNSGFSTGPHLHSEMRAGGVPMDFYELLFPAEAVSVQPTDGLARVEIHSLILRSRPVIQAATQVGSLGGGLIVRVFGVQTEQGLTWAMLEPEGKLWAAMRQGEAVFMQWWKEAK